MEEHKNNNRKDKVVREIYENESVMVIKVSDGEVELLIRNMYSGTALASLETAADIIINQALKKMANEN